MNKLMIIGASGHGKVVADIAEKNGYDDIAFLDDNTEIKICGKHKVIGRCEDAIRYNGADFIVAIGNTKIRSKLQTWLLENGLHIVSLLHPNAVVAGSVIIGVGTVVMAGAVINPYVKIGQGCIINTCSSIDHDCIIGAFVHISVGAHVAGTVGIGDNTWIGAGATVSNNVNICNNCMIGVGAVVVKDIELSGIYKGVPAKMNKTYLNCEYSGGGNT